MHALPGDVLVLTKPLGTQVAVNLMQWIKSDEGMWARVKGVISEQQVLTRAFLGCAHGNAPAPVAFMTV